MFHRAIELHFTPHNVLYMRFVSYISPNALHCFVVSCSNVRLYFARRRNERVATLTPECSSCSSIINTPTQISESATSTELAVPVNSEDLVRAVFYIVSKIVKKHMR